MYVYLLFCTGFTFFEFVQQQQQSVCYLHELLRLLRVNVAFIVYLHQQKLLFFL